MLKYYWINRPITNAVGIGGGGVILPIMMLFNFSVTHAVALTNIVIWVGAVTRYVLDFKEKHLFCPVPPPLVPPVGWGYRAEQHPMKNATIIDYGVVAIMMPWIMIGSFIGTQANVAAPPVIVLAILLVVMIFISFRSTKQGLKL